MSFLSVSHIQKEKDNQVVLHDISFVHHQFKKLAIAGETGSGKSTLLKIIAGIAQADAGEVFLHSQKVLGPLEKLLPGHPKIAYLSQHFELRNNYRVSDELDYANKLTQQQAEIIYNVCQIAHLLNRKTDQLSGGEKQRIATARLLIGSPALLLLDEPFSNLDMFHKQMMKEVINDICERLEITCILVSHDPLDTLSWADEMIVLKDGKLVQQGTPANIYAQPVNEYVAGLFGKYNLVRPPQAITFSSLPGIEMSWKNMLIRPEAFSITNDEHHSVRGMVKHIQYFGSYYELEVAVPHSLIKVSTKKCSVSKGDFVFLTLSPNSIWYFDE